MGMPGLGELTKMLPDIKTKMADMGESTGQMKILLEESIELQRRLIALQEVQLTPAQKAAVEARLEQLRPTG